MKTRKIIDPSKRYEGSPEENLNVEVNLKTSQNLLREGERDIVLDINKLFNDERNECKNYKIYGKIKPIFKNLYSGSTSYMPLKKNLHILGDGSNGQYDGYLPYNEFAFFRYDVYRQQNIPLSGSTPGLFTPDVVINSGYTGYQKISSIDAPYWNWNLYLSYVYTGDTNYPLKYTLTGNTEVSFKSGDGIPFRVYNYGKYYKLISPVEHGMTTDNYIVISGGTLNSTIPLSGRTFTVVEVGDEKYNSEKYVINLLKSEIPTTVNLGQIVLGKRCLDVNRIEDTTSEYYVHKHKTLTSEDEYILDKLGFESTIFEDEKKILFENADRIQDFVVEKNRMEVLQFMFKNPFTLTGLTNNFNYTPTEIYTTIIFRNKNGYFNYPPKVGYKIHFHDNWIDNHFDGPSSNEQIPFDRFADSGILFFSGQTLPIGSVLNGAFVEYNKNELKERIISEAYHKITSNVNVFYHDQDQNIYYSGASPTNLVGLFYQPHYRIKLRELSPYIETSDTDQIYNLPENVFYDNYEKLWKWRDLYEHGYIDSDGYGTNFPFLNNCHYVLKDINFYIRNELLYKNKKDGVSSFDNINKNKIDC